MARQIILHPGDRIALRQLRYRDELLHSVLLTYHDHGRGVELTPWYHDEPPHTLYYSGAWHLIEDDNADHHYLLRHE